ncbi:MAG: hypothetical protein AB2793_19765 [Candidatus Thiodiazotropha sp.]
MLEFKHADESVNRGLVYEGGDGFRKGRRSTEAATAPLRRWNMRWKRKGATGAGVTIERQ